MQEDKIIVGKYKYKCSRCGWTAERERDSKLKTHPIYCQSVDSEGRENCGGVAFFVEEEKE